MISKKMRQRPAPLGDWITVDMGEYKQANAPDVLETSGLGPCIAVGAMYGKKGFLFHEPSSSNSGFANSIRPLFDDLRRTVRNKSHLEIYIAGGAIDTVPDDIASAEESNREVLGARKTVEDMITEYGFTGRVKQKKWCAPNNTQVLRLDLGRRVAEIEEEDYRNLLDEPSYDNE